MKKYFAIALLAIPVLFAFTGDFESERKRLPSGCFLRSSIATKGVSLLQTKCQFTFKTTGGAIVTDSIKYSHNGVNGILRPDANGIGTVILPYGTTRFQFLYTTNFYEVYSDTINLKGGHVAKFDVLFEDATTEVICDKPVIYVYPDKTMNVAIRLNVQGTLGFTYPAVTTWFPYNKGETGWNFTADPDGTIHMNDKEYDYLFWDARIPFSAERPMETTGFVVDRDSLTTFFEKNLTAMGLNAREQQDFITYWCPLMQKYEKSFVHFRFNEDYNSIATINITPKPDNLFRVFMTWEDGSQSKFAKIKPQVIPSVKREGFTVIEWGGSDVSNASCRVQ